MSTKKLVLDYSKWRCGMSGHNKLGVGYTSLKNLDGYMCCLGQWCQQLGVDEKELGRNGEPWLLKTKADISLFTESDNGGGLQNNKLALNAMFINDELATSPAEKINKLTTLLASHNIELEVINIPK